MSKRDSLKFTVKKSLVVGTATASLAVSGCIVNTGGGTPEPSDTSGGDATAPADDASDAVGTDTEQSPDSSEAADSAEGDADGTSSTDGS